MEAFEVLFKAVGALLVCGLMGNVLSDLQDGPTKAELRKIADQELKINRSVKKSPSGTFFHLLYFYFS